MNKPLIAPPSAFEFSEEDNKRVIYICGPHGVGKSTLFTDLKFYDAERVREQLTHYDALQENMTRQLWRSSLHCIEHRENLNYVKNQPDNTVVIGDRCFLDDIAYVNAFVKLGWMTAQERDKLFSLTDDIYDKTGTPKPEMFIILLPPYEWNVERIMERWSKGEDAKWCEMNFEYLKAVRDEFSGMMHFGISNTITETDREGRILEVKRWLNENDLQDFIVEGKVFVESPVGTGS